MLDLSIIIPAYNEAQKVGADILAAATFLEDQALAGEILVVDDGSTDDTAAWAERVRVPPAVNRRVLRLASNRGKGYAVRTGVAASTGHVVMFADAGGCIPYAQALDGLALLEDPARGIAVGSRRSPQSRITTPQTPYRRLCSLAFRLAVRLLLPELGHLDDTQCGFKLYDGPLARELFAASRIDGFLFDVEILVLAAERGVGIAQFPVTWSWDRDSRLSPSRHTRSVLRDLWAIRRARDRRRAQASGQRP